MKELHIPYGINRQSRMIIEPEDAERGRACGCLCPGCEAPLLSRHPKRDDRRIHFAHDSKHTDAKPLDDCPLSPEVALAMMARYIATNLTGKIIQLSELEKSLYHPCCLSPSTLIELIPKQETIIERAQHSVSLGTVTYDLGLTLNGKSYFIDIVYVGKPKKDLPATEHLHCIGGIISIAAGEYLAMMQNPEFNVMRYSESVEYFLLNYVHKDWEYHHLEAARMTEAHQQHKCPPALSTQLFSHRQTPNYSSYSNLYGTNTNSPAHETPANEERIVTCFYCGQPMTTRSTKTPAMGHKCGRCRKYNRQAPHPRSPITKTSNHNANMAAEKTELGASGGYKDLRG